MEGGNALADVLFGQRDPGGRLTDTWARRYADYPASATFSSNDGNSLQEDYTENIYVGYRWFDSFGIEPLFPFGYGMSYTSFAMQAEEIRADWNQVSLQVCVTNTGKHPGRQVAQLYVSAPAGKLDKPWQELKAFAKTKTLAPGESETVTLCFATETLASFDEERSAWVMEPGDYMLRLGEHSRKTEIAAVVTLDHEVITRTVTDILRADHPLEVKKPSPYAKETIPASALKASLSADDSVPTDNRSKMEKRIVTYIPQGKTYTPYAGKKPWQLPWPCEEEVKFVEDCPEATFPDVKAEKVSMEAFVASLEPEVLTRIVTGTLEETPYITRTRMKKKLKPLNAPQSSGMTTGKFVASLGIPNAYMGDGPAGVHVVGCAATSFPVGTAQAQTWDADLIQAGGAAYGQDMESFMVTVALGPGMNIHRDPLCGRNFEYYSEDPLITGRTASAFTRGVQSRPGRYVSIKHFATNNQENDRLTGNNTVTPRSLREIYLKGFEICVREASLATVMTSYNSLNGIHTSSNRELVTDLLRGEWGFDGMVMTDWGTASEKGFDLHAGNDLIMGGYRAEKLLEMMKEIPPVFGEDGAIQETVKSAHFGMVKTVLTSWGNFVPEAGGKDIAIATVAAGKALSPKVDEAVKSGLAKVEALPDGSKKVIWHGTNRGAYLSLGDLQACAIRVLKSLMRSAAMAELENKL